MLLLPFGQWAYGESNEVNVAIYLLLLFQQVCLFHFQPFEHLFFEIAYPCLIHVLGRLHGADQKAIDIKKTFATKSRNTEKSSNFAIFKKALKINLYVSVYA